MEISRLFLLLPLIFVLSCGGGPQPQSDPVPPPPPPAQPTPVVEEAPPPQPVAFDPGKVSQQVIDTTKEDVQKFIGDLNGIIKSKNFNGWKAVLSDEYFAKVSSAEFLRETSEQPALKTRKIVLRTVQDYFTNVVVPSRANDRVDEIEFISENRVKAYTINGSRQLRLYDLEHEGNNWKIIN